ncbi:hypothetical protein D1831_00045 [Lactiplantibacillus garii]|uniref:Integral membrane protein n=1 Tax=Lactiplantibacillus garii TaxID=2306423 RepID=A0A3R8J9C3_9LACO|nr:hypothetical protein D1831_00045 [Lactiplantibacillus garii]
MPARRLIVLDLTLIMFAVSLFFIWQKVLHAPLGGYALISIALTLGLFIYWLRLVIKDHNRHV